MSPITSCHCQQMPDVITRHDVAIRFTCENRYVCFGGSSCENMDCEREGPGSDSIVGESVPLPKKLGGDPITTSGLIYNQSGDAFYLEDNNGDLPWPVMQRELNAALDEVAQQAGCEDGLEVDVVAMEALVVSADWNDFKFAVFGTMGTVGVRLGTLRRLLVVDFVL